MEWIVNINGVEHNITYEFASLYTPNSSPKKGLFVDGKKIGVPKWSFRGAFVSHFDFVIDQKPLRFVMYAGTCDLIMEGNYVYRNRPITKNDWLYSIAAALLSASCLGAMIIAKYFFWSCIFSIICAYVGVVNSFSPLHTRWNKLKYSALYSALGWIAALLLPCWFL